MLNLILIAATIAFGSAPAPPAEQLGMPLTLVLPSPIARAALRDGLANLSARHYSEAIIKFEEAVALSPDFDEARYSLVRARAQLGAFDSPQSLQIAASDMASLLRRDYPTYAPEFRTHPDLEPLRRSQHGPALLELDSSLAKTWGEIRVRGIPGLLIERRQSRQPSSRTSTLSDIITTRAGHYDPVTKRFYTSTPPTDNLVAARHERDYTQLFAVQYDFCTGHNCPRPIHFSTYIFGSEPTTKPLISKVMSNVGQTGRHDMTAILGHRGAWISVPGDVEDDHARNQPTYPRYVWAGLDAAPPQNPRPAPPSLDNGCNIRRSEAHVIEIDPRGAIGPSSSLHGFSLDRGVLTTPSGKVELGFRHRRATRTIMYDDPESVLVVSNRDTCVLDYNKSESGFLTVFWSALSVVDRKSLKRTHHQYHHNKSSTVHVAATGQVFVQVGEEVTFWPSIAAVATERGETLPPNFILELLPLRPRLGHGP